MTPKKMNRQRGAEGEEWARRYLEGKGFVFERRNFRTRDGEIDLIMREGDTLVFVEVKLRTTVRFGHGSEAVTPAKQRTIRKVATAYLQRYGYVASAPSVRFDVISIVCYRDKTYEVTHIPHAF